MSEHMPDLDELERLAKAVPLKEDWRAGGYGAPARTLHFGSNLQRLTARGVLGHPAAIAYSESAELLAYIAAAHPQAILALIERIRVLEALPRLWWHCSGCDWEGTDPGGPCPECGSPLVENGP